MKTHFLLFLFTAALLSSGNSRAQTWDLFAPASSGLRSDSILDLRSNTGPSSLDVQSKSGSWLTYVLHPHAISRFNGLWYYDRNTFGADMADREENNVLYFDPGGGLWIGRTNGIYFVPMKSLNSPNPVAQDCTKTFFPDANLNKPVVTAIYRDRQQVFWIGTRNRGLFRFGPQTGFKSITGIAFATQQCIDAIKVTDIVEDALTGSIWIGTTAGIFRIDAKSGSCRVFDTFWVDKEILGLHADREGRVWAATNNGLHVATYTTVWRFSQVCTSISCSDTTGTAPIIRDVTQDYSGTIWAVSESQVFRYQQSDSLPPNHWKRNIFSGRKDWPAEVTGINHVSVDRAGFVWVSSQTQGLLRYNMLWENVSRDAIGVQSDKVITLSLSPVNNNLYVGTEDGAAWRDKSGKWNPITDLPTCTIYSFFHDPTGLVLMGVDCRPESIVGLKENSVITFFCQSCPTDLDEVFEAIVKLPDDTLWFAGEDDLWAGKIDNSDPSCPSITYKKITGSLGLPSQKFHTLLLQDSTFVWIGTDKSGLVRYSIATHKVDSLPKVGQFTRRSVVRSLHFDNQGKLWIGTDKGLTRLDNPSDFSSPIWTDILDTRDAVSFVFSDKKGGIWFDADDGVDHYNVDAGVTHFPRRAEGGPASEQVHAGVSVPENGQESFWFGTEAGISIFHGDLIPPETGITTPSSDTEVDTSLIKFLAPNVIRLASNSLFVQYEGGDNFTPDHNLDFQTAFVKVRQGETINWKTLPWSNFTRDRARLLAFPDSGSYYFFVRTRDQSGNLDPQPACLVILADIDPPSVVITQPAPTADGSLRWVPGRLEVRGSVLDADLDSFVVEIIDPETKRRIIDPRTGQRFRSEAKEDTIRNGVLAIFKDAGVFNARAIRIRVTAVDYLKHFRRDSINVRVDNEPPKLTILRPRDSTQVSSDVSIDFRFVERHHLPTIKYIEPGATETKEATIKNVRPDMTTPATDDSLFSITASVGNTVGEHKLIFTLNDSAGNTAQQSLVVRRVAPQISNRGTIWQSRDGIVQVYLPPGAESDPVTVRISPLAVAYRNSAIDQKLQPKSDAYQVELDKIMNREMTLTFTLRDVGSDTNRLAIFQRADSIWKSIGGKFSSQEKTLRAGVKQGGIYLAALGEIKSLESGNVTCLPRMFSPGREALAAFTDVVFSLNRESPVFIHIYNTAGRQVWRLIDDGKVMPPGRHAVRWDGFGNDRQKLRSGIYIVVVKANTFAETKTVVIQN